MEKRFAYEHLSAEIQARADQMNLEEKEVPAWTAPALPFDETCTGTEFQMKIRPRLVRAMEKYMYGKIPPRCSSLEFRLTAEGQAFNGAAIRREIDIICRHGNGERVIHLLMYLPAGAQKPVPVFVGLNFNGNHTTAVDPEIIFHPFDRYPALDPYRHKDSRSDENARGIHAGRFCFEEVIRHGFAAATACYWDIYPDHPDGFMGSVMSLFYTDDEWHAPVRNTGAISAWAWGYSRILDCLENQPEIDSSRFIVHGHSRLGKTALWAGANDQRIALTVSNCSGTCGAKMAHRYFGEDFSWLKVWNPHWFCTEFYKYADRDLEFPVDQHFLLAAIAPRLLFVASGTEDCYADPRGEFASAKAAAAAWKISGGSGLGTDCFPEAGHLIGNEIGYYLRAGEHDFTPENWNVLMAFTERHLAN